MRLRNATSIPDQTIRDIVRFVKPHNVSGFDVRVGLMQKGWLGFKGRAYARGSSYHDRRCPFVNCYLSQSQKYPTPPDNRDWLLGKRGHASRGYLPHPYFASEVEALVFLMAHEIRHLWQRKVPRGYRVWGARGQYSERDADAYAIRKLREWRREH